MLKHTTPRTESQNDLDDILSRFSDTELGVYGFNELENEGELSLPVFFDEA